jgi:hypothetical protein
VADELDRTLNTDANIYKYRASTILGRVEARGYATDDAFWIHVRGELVQHLLEAVEQPPSALRQRAYALRNASEDAQSTLDLYARHVKRLRSSRGPAPSVAMYTLFASTDRWKVSILEELLALDQWPVPKPDDADDRWQRKLVSMLCPPGASPEDVVEVLAGIGARRVLPPDVAGGAMHSRERWPVGVVTEHRPRRSRPETPDDLRVGTRPK